MSKGACFTSRRNFASLRGATPLLCAALLGIALLRRRKALQRGTQPLLCLAPPHSALPSPLLRTAGPINRSGPNLESYDHFFSNVCFPLAFSLDQLTLWNLLIESVFVLVQILAQSDECATKCTNRSPCS
jgi:hypothetical protein